MQFFIKILCRTEEICLFQWKASGETLKIQKPPATPTSIHKYKKYLNSSGDPVPLRPSKIIHLVTQSLLPVRAERAGPLLKAGVHAAMPGHLVLGYANSSNPSTTTTFADFPHSYTHPRLLYMHMVGTTRFSHMCVISCWRQIYSTLLA